MKYAFALFAVTLVFACNSSKKTTALHFPLNGTWIPTKQEFRGSAFPSTVYDHYKLIMKDSSYTYGIGSEDRGAIHYENGRMDIYGRQGINAGKHFKAIYKLENSELIICYNLTGDVYPEAYDTKDKANYFLSVYAKEQ